MKNLLYLDKDTAKHSFLYTYLFLFAAHAYRYFNLGFTDDSVEIVQSSNKMWQIGLGRFLQPFYWELRGDIVAPYLIGMLTGLWLSIAVYLIVRLLELKRETSLVLLCAVLTCNSTMAISNGTYVSWSDVYMLAFMLAVLGVACWRYMPRLGTLLAGGLICASLALYQAYFQAAILLYLILLVKMLIDGEDMRVVWIRGLSAVASLLLSLLLYELGVRIFEAHYELTRTNNYNGISNVGSFGGVSMLKLMAETYVYPITYYLNPTAHLPKVTALMYVLLLVITGVALILVIQEKRFGLRRAAMMIALVLLIPLGMNAVYFISAGLGHSLMQFSYFLFFGFTLYLLEQICEGRAGEIGKYVSSTAILALIVVCFNHAVYANQLYVRRDLEFQSTMSVMTRVIDRAEQVEGYQPGYTPVAIIGTMYNSPLSMERPGFEHLKLEQYSMNTNNFATTGESFYPYYFWQIHGYPFNLLGEFERKKIAEEQDVKNMPVFPQQGSIQMRDGILVIKLGAVAGSD